MGEDRYEARGRTVLDTATRGLLMLDDAVSSKLVALKLNVGAWSRETFAWGGENEQGEWWDAEGVESVLTEKGSFDVDGASALGLEVRVQLRRKP